MDENTTLGRRIKRLRLEKRLTQEDLAEQADMSPVMVAKTEQGRRYPRYPVLQRLARALDVPVSELTDRRPRLGAASEASVLALRDAILSPAVVGLHAEDAEPLEPQVMRAAVDTMAWLYWDGDFAVLCEELPRLIVQARATRRQHGPAAATALVLAYDRAAGLLVHFGREDLAAVAAERGIAAAEGGDDEALLATMHGTYAWCLLHQGRLAEAEAIAATAARGLEPHGKPADRDFAAYGNTLMTAVGPAASAGKDTGDYLTEASQAAGRMSGPTFLWATTFSRSSVGMQACFTHAVQRDPAKALAAARDVNLADLPGPVSRGRHLLDVAQAHTDARHPVAAVSVLTEAHKLAPMWFAHQGVAKLLVAELLERQTRISAPLRKLAAATDADGYTAYYRPARLAQNGTKYPFPGTPRR
jgi:transcriptional regulator with XRE-family HTH domain